MINSAISSAANGIRQNYLLFANAVDRISDPDTVAGITEIMEMKKAEHGIKVNVAVIARANEMTDDLIDILA